MVKLVTISFDEFKEEIYPYYLELFPKNERKSLNSIEKPYLKSITKLVKIVDGDTTVGFLIYNTIPDIKYVQLDYFAIFKKYQNQKYGSQAIFLFKDYFKDYYGIYGEVEKLGYGKTQEENNIRKKRIKFWENLGFTMLDVDLCLFDVVYTACIYKITDKELDTDDIIDSAFKIYMALIGEKRVNDNCRVIKDNIL